VRVQCVALKITCMKVLVLERLKTLSFLFNQIAQHMAVKPTQICPLSLGRMPWSQEPNMFEMLDGG
jgi:hypothetical protein